MSIGGRWDIGDPEVDAFVDANLVSFAAWDLVVYLNRNPGTCETIANLAGVLARQESDLEPAVLRLTEKGTLIAHPGEIDCYELSPDPAVRNVVSRFITLAGRREHRLEFVRRVLAHVTGG